MPSPMWLQNSVLLSHLRVLPGPRTFPLLLYSPCILPLPHTALAPTSHQLPSSRDCICSVFPVSVPLLLPTLTKRACRPQPPPWLALAALPTCHLVHYSLAPVLLSPACSAPGALSSQQVPRGRSAIEAQRGGVECPRS